MKIKELLESKDERRVVKDFGQNYINNPTILDVEPGHMIRVKEDVPKPNPFGGPLLKQWGTIVLDVNYKSELVLVGDSVGYPAERKEWVHINDVNVTWDIGGMARAEELLGKFGNEVDDTMDKRAIAKQEQPPPQQDKKPKLH